MKDPTNIRGSWYMTESCSKMEAGSWNDARKATCLFRILVASLTNTLGKPSANFLQMHVMLKPS